VGRPRQYLTAFASARVDLLRLDWFPTLLAAAGDADIIEHLLKGTQIGNKTFKVHLVQPEERHMIRKLILAAATVAAIGAAGLIPTEASAGGGGPSRPLGHGYGRGFGGIVVIGPSCWRWIPGFGKVYVCY
jgi:hypothetical protein